MIGLAGTSHDPAGTATRFARVTAPAHMPLGLQRKKALHDAGPK